MEKIITFKCIVIVECEHVRCGIGLTIDKLHLINWFSGKSDIVS